MNYFVYIIQSKTTGKIYIGQTNNLTKRLKRHNKKLPFNPKGYTAKNKGPWKLIYKEALSNRKEAAKREKELKTARGRQFIKEKILGR